MQLINRNNAVIMIKKRISSTSRLHVTITTWKRDRKIEVIKNNNQYSIIENGFKHFTANKLKLDNCLLILKQKMNIEFPHSHQVYISFK